MALGEELRDAFRPRLLLGAAIGLERPSTRVPGIAIAAAEHLATYLAERGPLVIAFSTGRMLRAVADEMPAMDCPQHKLVSLVGTISRDGQASSYEVVRRFAERTGAQCFPIPTPVVASSVEERRLLQSQRSFAVVRELAAQAVAAFVGIGNIGWQAPMHRDHFVTDQEIAELIDEGGRGGDRRLGLRQRRPVGRQLRSTTAMRPCHWTELKQARMIGVSGSPDRVDAIRAALRGGLLGGLITDERTAMAVLRARNEP